jgi:hypothetical protein
MNYVLPLEDRMQLAEAQRERYARDPVFRLRQINRSRERRQMPPVRDLSEVKPRGRFA